MMQEQNQNYFRIYIFRFFIYLIGLLFGWGLDLRLDRD